MLALVSMACAGTRGAAPEAAGAPLLLLPLETRGRLPEETVAAAERALRDAARRAGRQLVPPPPVDPEAPSRPVVGDEPDAVLAAHAAAAGAPALLASWTAPLPDGSIAWGLRLLETPAVDPAPGETREAEAPAGEHGERSPGETPGAEAPPAEPAPASPSSAPPAEPSPPPVRPLPAAGSTGAPEDRPGPADGGSPETPAAPLPRTADRAGGRSADARGLSLDLRRAATRLLAGPPPSSPRGQRTAGDLARRLKARSGRFDACFAERLLASPDLAGVALLQIEVDVAGTVRDVRFAGSSFADPALEACLADAAAHVDFPPGVGGRSVLEQRLFWPPPVVADGK